MATHYSARPNWFAVSWFGQFMASGIGRAVRIILGAAMIAGGLLWIGGPGGYLVAALGLVFLLAGTFDKCVLSPLFGGPFAGPEIRALRGR